MAASDDNNGHTTQNQKIGGHSIDGGHDEVDEKDMRSSRARADRKYRFSNRGNSEFKWKEDHSVVGALEIPCEPFIDLRAKYKEKNVIAFQDEFHECLQLWNTLKLRKSFVSAAESIPPVTKCCGLSTDTDETIQVLVKLLNKGWAKKASDKLKEHGYKVECYCWSWTNPLGSAETNILLIRFHSLTKERN